VGSQGRNLLLNDAASVFSAIWNEQMTEQISRPPSNVKIFPPRAHGAAAPRGALKWRSAAERNRLLKDWRRAVCGTFGEQSRCLRVAWVLADSFNAKTGYAYPSNGWLANETHLAENKLRAALRTLELGNAIVRGWVHLPNGQTWRVIYPSAAMVPRPTVGQGGSPSRWGTITAPTLHRGRVICESLSP
jgi:hypothetical protein